MPKATATDGSSRRRAKGSLNSRVAISAALITLVSRRAETSARGPWVWAHTTMP